MRVFLTGATGFIGSRIVPELLAAGHQVLGLTRSDSGTKSLEAAGAQVHRGTLEDPDSLAAGAAEADAVIHTAFDHDFSNFAAICEKDNRVIQAMGAVLKGSNRPLLITSGIGFGAMQHGDIATEDAFNANNPHPRAISEVTADALVEAGVNVSVVRLPQVHDTVKQGLITPYVGVSRDKGVVVYVGEGRNRWSAAHVSDVARLYVLALGAAKPGARYHAVAEEGIAVRDIAAVVGQGLKVPVKSITPEEAPQYLGWLSMFAAMDLPASSALTRQRLGWNPVGPDLITDLKAMDYSVVTKIA